MHFAIVSSDRSFESFISRREITIYMWPGHLIRKNEDTMIIVFVFCYDIYIEMIYLNVNTSNRRKEDYVITNNKCTDSFLFFVFANRIVIASNRKFVV